MRRLKIILLAVVLPVAVLVAVTVIMMGRLRAKPDKPDTATVERGDVAVTVEDTGSVQPITQVEVRSKVAGLVVELAVDEGDHVEQGQLIARLDVPELEAQRDQIRAQVDGSRARLQQARLSLTLDEQLIESQVVQAQSNLRVAQTGLEEAETRRRDAERVYQNKQRLFDMGGYVSQDEVDSTRAAFDLAVQACHSAEERVQDQTAAVTIAEARRAEVAMSESRVAESEASQRQIQDSLAEIEARLQDAVIRAPCSGVVILRHVREGELITAVSYYGEGAPIITIGDLSTMLVEVNLNEVDIDRVEIGQPVEMHADALLGRTFEGRITRISPASITAPQTGAEGIVRFPVEITIAGSHADLRPGMTADVEIFCERVQDVLWVPSDAVFEEDDQMFVTVVTGEKEGEPITEDREVTIGLTSDARAEILSGLEEGDEVELGKADRPERRTFDFGGKSEDDPDED